MKVKKGDKFHWIDMPELGVGVVYCINNDNSFDMMFRNDEDRGTFYEHEIGKILRPLSKLEKVLE